MLFNKKLSREVNFFLENCFEIMYDGGRDLVRVIPTKTNVTI